MQLNNDRAESILMAALAKHTPAERSAYLKKACGEDARLRQHVQQLLSAHDDAGSFLEGPPVGLRCTEATDKHPDDTTSPAGKVVRLDFLSPCDKPDRIGMLGPYEIIEIVGEGGMGIVLRAHEPRLNRLVAVKVMKQQLASNAMAVKRFMREAQAAAAVSHDHVVTIHAVDEVAGLPVLVMEYVAGHSLQEKIDSEGALGVVEILRIGMQTASGLAAAHKQGLVHRDIKPSNILLENGIQRVKITDFGLARAVDDVTMTKEGQVAGTPQYMSPEQARGETVDQRADLFSLGSVLYTMCTGRPAFRADSTMGVLRRVCEDAPRPIREINPDIPQWLAEIVERLLEKDTSRRIQTSDEVADLWGRHLAHLQQPAVSPLPPRLEPLALPNGQTGSSTLRWRRYAVMATILFVIGGALSFSAYFGWTRIGQNPALWSSGNVDNGKQTDFYEIISDLPALVKRCAPADNFVLTHTRPTGSDGGGPWHLNHDRRIRCQVRSDEQAIREFIEALRTDIKRIAAQTQTILERTQTRGNRGGNVRFFEIDYSTEAAHGRVAAQIENWKPSAIEAGPTSCDVVITIEERVRRPPPNDGLIRRVRQGPDDAADASM